MLSATSIDRFLASPELVPPVDVLLLEAEDDGAEVLVAGEVVPVLCPVEVLLVRLLLHRGQPELPVALPLLLDRGLLAAAADAAAASHAAGAGAGDAAPGGPRVANSEQRAS